MVRIVYKKCKKATVCAAAFLLVEKYLSRGLSRGHNPEKLRQEVFDTRG